ncbi:MAG: NADH-quinone oxidoreductase subunit H [candidate division WOR-3 bacterium]|nr:NADH-quinone oxidoreductase subunit H [candidate division WOR-3 bacterium]MCX7756886.1 NADH-quinone oxidoreductase subunit H [candidate division WOR-3 bacterium]MDW7987390.1 complex I subunit 1 family protein [candidate division WOR-3 bacterium]
MSNYLKFLLEFLIFPGLVFVAIIGLLLSWLDRKISARLQWRVGPPWYQCFADIIKLFGKETIIPQGRKLIFLLAPIVSAISVILISVLLYNANFYPQCSFLGDIILVIYLLALPPLMTILGASASKNPLSSVGASREMTLYFAYELPFVIVTILLIMKAHGSIRLFELINYQKTHGAYLYSISGVITFIIYLFTMQAKLGYVPFDIAEAEQEIMAGVYTEYSGFALAMFKLTKAMLLFVFPMFIITLVWGGINSISTLWKFAIIFILTVLVKNTNPRVRIDQALKFFWLGMTPLAILGLILGLYKL